MLIYTPSQLPTDEATLRAALAEYQAALVVFADTVGVPAPLPAYDILYAIVADGGEFTVNYPPPPPVPPIIAPVEQFRFVNGAARMRRKFVRAAKINPIAALLLKEGIK